MQFRTEVNVVIPKFKIEHFDALFFMGSCFAENIAEKVHELKFNTLINPNGILYNPYSIAQALHTYMQNKQCLENELFFHDNRWHSWQHHSRYSDAEKQNCLKRINADINAAHLFLKQCNYLFITFGSAFVYKHITDGSYVANCHKVPNKQFEKNLLSIEYIEEEWQKIINEIQLFNPNIKIIFTLSPVRYMRDGITENTRSKARLIEAIHSLIAQNNTCYYFPAYELLMDDLRDYRFYENDLLHPNSFAINYVWEKFSEACFSEEALKLMAQIQQLISAENHRPFNTNSESYKSFIATIECKKKELQAKYPYVKF
jgi:hypothetical protein